MTERRSSTDVIWQARRLVLATVVGFVIVAAIVSELLPKVYSASATLLVVQNGNAATFDAVQAAQVTARTYASIIDSTEVARLVAARLNDGSTTTSIHSDVSAVPVPETQLLKITAEAGNAVRAEQLANTYGSVVIQFAHKYLGASAGATLATASVATEPTSPSRPKPALYVLIAAFLGFAAACGAALAFDRLDKRLRTSEEVSARFDELILARMPRWGRTKDEISESAMREAFGMLRTNLRFARSGGDPKVVAVTSAREAEGKTTCVTEIAIAMAEVGLKVITIDTDLRNPQLERDLMNGRSGRGRKGFADLLDETVSVDDAVNDTRYAGIELVGTGTLPDNPAAFLESHSLGPVLRDLAGRADLVLLDCPPLSAGADASILATGVDGVIVVVDLERSTERMLREALRQLSLVRASVLGLVLNKDSAPSLFYPYDYARRSESAA